MYRSGGTVRAFLIASLAAFAATPAAAFVDVDGEIRILAQDQSTFDTTNTFGFGTITSTAAAAPSVGSLTISTANGGTISASYTGHSFGDVGGFLNYTMSVAGPDGAPVPVLIDTHAGITASGDMAGFIYLRIGSLYQLPGAFIETPDYPLTLNAALCSGAEAPCETDPGQSSWSLTGTTIYLVPNRIYPVELQLTLQQRGYNSSGVFGNGTGTAFVDPTFTLAPGVVGYTLSNSLLPEPASWALLLTGFGLTGVLLRRRGAVRA